MEKVLPKGWVETTLGEIAEWGSGGTPNRAIADYYNGTIPWVKTGDLNDGLITHSNEFITELGLQKSSAKIFPKGSVVLAMYGATIGKTGILDFDSSTNQACAVAKTFFNMNKFLFLFLKSEKETFIEKGKGGAQPNISQTVIKTHKIVLPPLAEQERIVAKLNALFTQHEVMKKALDRIPQLLKAFRQRVLTQAVTGKLTEEWRKGKDLKNWDYCNLEQFIKSSFYGPRFSKDDYSSKGYMTLRTTDMDDNGNFVLTTEIPRIKVPDSKKIELYKIEKGDLLITRTGSIGKMAMYNYDEIAIPSAYLIRFRFNKNADTKFLYYALNSPFGKKQMGLSAVAVAVSNLNAEKIKQIIVPNILLQEQQEVVSRVKSLFAKADAIEARYTRLKEKIASLPQALLHKAFKGELVPQLPTDGDAKDLLAQIMALKNEVKGRKK